MWVVWYNKDNMFKINRVFLFVFVCTKAIAVCPNGYHSNTIDISKLSSEEKGIWQASVATYTHYSYTSQGLKTRCEGYDNRIAGGWFGTDEGGTCIDCRFDNMKHGDWYIEFDSEKSGFSTLRGTSACISTSYASGVGVGQPSDGVNPSPGERSGSSCWCKLLSIDEIAVDSRWLYDGSNGHWPSSTCVQECAQTCASEIRNLSNKMLKSMFAYTKKSVVSGCTANNQEIYNITYDLAGGQNYKDAPFCYKITSGDIVFGQPVKSGEVFAYWKNDKNKVIDSIVQGQTGDIHLIAQWRSNLLCPAGQYLFDGLCVNVGAGFYSPADDNLRYQCPNNLTTRGYGFASDELGDCGYKLHIGKQQIFLRSQKNTSPSFCAKINNKVFYGSMTSNDKCALCTKYKGVNYSIHDDSIYD